MVSLVTTALFVLQWTSNDFQNPPTIGGGKVFAYRYIPSNHSVDMVALKLSDGSQLWQAPLGGVVWLHPMTFADGRVYAQSNYYVERRVPAALWALNANDGTLVYNKPQTRQWPKYKAPTYFDGKLYMISGYVGGIAAHDAMTGQQIWFHKLSGNWGGYSPLVNQNYVMTYVGGPSNNRGAGKLLILDRLNGHTVDTVADPGFKSTNYEMEANLIKVKHKPLYVGLYNRHVVVFKWKPNQIGNGSIEWDAKDNFRGQPALRGQELYVINHNTLERRNVNNGNVKKVWTSPSSDKLRHDVLVSGKHIVVTDRNQTYILNAKLTHLKQTLPYGGYIRSKGKHLAIMSNGTLALYKK